MTLTTNGGFCPGGCYVHGQVLSVSRCCKLTIRRCDFVFVQEHDAGHLVAELPHLCRERKTVWPMSCGSYVLLLVRIPRDQRCIFGCFTVLVIIAYFIAAQPTDAVNNTRACDWGGRVPYKPRCLFLSSTILQYCMRAAAWKLLPRAAKCVNPLLGIRSGRKWPPILITVWKLSEWLMFWGLSVQRVAVRVFYGRSL